jgi:hypothetical protein
MPEKINFRVGIPGSGYDAYGRKRKPWLKPLRLHEIIKEIKAKNMETWLQEALIKKVSNCPIGALKHFYANFDKYVQILRQEKLENERKRNEEN